LFKIRKFNVSILYQKLGKLIEEDYECEKLNIVDKGITFVIKCNDKEIECDIISKTCY